MRKTKTILLIMSALITSSIFGQSENILDGLSTSYDYAQKAVTSIAMAVENMTEAYNYLTSNGTKRFIRFTLDNLENSKQQIAKAQSELNSITSMVSNLDNKELHQSVELIKNQYTELLDDLTNAITAVKDAHEQRFSTAIDSSLRKATEAIESVIIKIASLLEETNKVVLLIQ